MEKEFNYNTDLIGLSIEEAITLANANSYSIRITKSDGQPCMVTCDMQFKRINVHTEDKKIVHVKGLG